MCTVAWKVPPIIPSLSLSLLPKDYKLEDSCGPCIEIYKDDAIQFIVVLDPRDGFFVPNLPPPPPPLSEDTTSKEAKKKQ